MEKVLYSSFVPYRMHLARRSYLYLISVIVDFSSNQKISSQFLFTKIDHPLQSCRSNNDSESIFSHFVVFVVKSTNF